MSARRLHIDYVAADAPAAPRRVRRAGARARRRRACWSIATGDARSRSSASTQARECSAPSARRPRVLPREKLQEEAKGAEAALRQLALPWRAIIETVEGAATADVAILQLQPDAQQRLLRLVADRAQPGGHARVRAHPRRRGDDLADPHVVNHQVQVDDPRRPDPVHGAGVVEGAAMNRVESWLRQAGRRGRARARACSSPASRSISRRCDPPNTELAARREAAERLRNREPVPARVGGPPRRGAAALLRALSCRCSS